MARILVYGWYGKGNCGDESYKNSFPRLFPSHELRFAETLNADLIDSHDALVVGGGNIIDLHHLSHVNRFANNLKGKPVVAFSVGFTDSGVMKEHLRIFDHIYVRDEPALERLKGMGVLATYCPDAAFGMEADWSWGRERWVELFHESRRDLYDHRVAIVLNAHLTSGGGDTLARDAYRFQLFANEMAHVCDHTNASFLFLPFGVQPPWDDRVPNSWTAGRCKWFKKNLVSYENRGVQETLDLIAGADVVVSMRYHSTVFSVVAEVPFIDIYHHDKNHSFLKTLGVTSWGIPYWDFSRDRISELLGKQLGDFGDRRERISQINREQRSKLRGCVDAIRFD